jgi:hypothetical protein
MMAALSSNQAHHRRDAVIESCRALREPARFAGPEQVGHAAPAELGVARIVADVLAPGAALAFLTALIDRHGERRALDARSGIPCEAQIIVQ